MTALRASIIIVAYNSSQDLGPCLDALLADMSALDELIVVDNGSSDGSVSLVQREYPQVRLVCGPNTGYAGGNNRGAALAQGTYLVVLNPDTVVEPGTLSALIEPLEHCLERGLTTPCIVYMDRPDIVNACGNIMHYSGLTYCRGAGQPVSSFQVACSVDAISGAAWAIRRDLFNQLGGFEERFFMYVEDTDLSWRARLAGYECWYIPTAVVRHAYHPAYSPVKAFYLDRNRHWMLLKNLAAPLYLRMIPGLLISELVTWGFLLLKGPRYWTVKWQVYRWLWREWRTIRSQATGRPALAHQRALLKAMTYQLDFGQLAGRHLSWLARGFFHPAFWLARWLLIFFVLQSLRADYSALH